jgi:hypothetical protein
MNHTPETTSAQTPHEYFDPTDEGLRAAWVSLLSRYPWCCFATLTFKNPRHDSYEIVNAFDIWLMKWHETEAIANGAMKKVLVPRKDAYGRPKPDRVKRSGTWWNKWRKGQGRPVYVLGIEPHQSGDLHLHAVIKFNTPWTMQRCVGWRIWSMKDYKPGMDMGWSRIEPPASQLDVAGYCSKYVTKGGDLVLSSSFNAKGISSPSLTDLAHAI